MNFISNYFPVPHVDRHFYKVAVATVITIPQQQSRMEISIQQTMSHITKFYYLDTLSPTCTLCAKRDSLNPVAQLT